MLSLATITIFGILAALFATQNTQITQVTFSQYTFGNVPVYLIVLVSVFVGILVSWIISLVNTIGTSLTLQGKDGTIQSAKKEIAELTRRVHQLELENTRLHSQLGDEEDKRAM